MTALEIIGAIAIPVVKSVFGWLEVSLKDNKITMFEWRELAVTFLRVGVPTAMIYLGLNQAGFDFSLMGAAAGGYLFDKVISAIKKKKK